MGAVNETVINGWVSTNSQRGSIDILWSCCVTVLLCCWVAVIPNVGSPKDKWYHKAWDKLNLACIAFLGPDLIFGIAWGQFSSARRSVKVCPGKSINVIEKVSSNDRNLYSCSAKISG